ncbi:unnamed protein product [Rotaria sp. Silwood1]|nr:unnamed protein product [Rotaria sp. Silwood1]
MKQQFVLFIVSLILFEIDYNSAANWAVLVAGSNGWYNYRHQADLCHAYQILHKNGIPDSNIIVMMYDDLAHNRENPTKGIIINHPNGADVYHGVPHDYNGKNVTPKNFINILLGNKEAMRNIGSGKVLESGPDDNVFIYFTDHGAVGLVAFPTGVLYAKDFNDTIIKMYNEKKYKQMVIYIEACESGSMFENILLNNINIYATTASNAEESSYACYFDEKRQTYLGDLYSVVWMEDSDVEKINQESLYQQYLIAKRKTNTSHVMQYGDLILGKTHNVSEFQSTENFQHNFIQNYDNNIFQYDVVPSESVRLSIIARRLANIEENSIDKENLEHQLAQLIHERAIITNNMQKIASIAVSMNRGDYLETVIEKRLKLTEHDCYISVTQYIQEKCFDLQNEFVLNKLYIMVNLCEIGLDDLIINQAIDQIQMMNIDNNNNKFYFETKNYFIRFVPNEDNLDIINGDDKLNLIINPISRNIRHALEYCVNDLRHDRDKTIERLLNEKTANDILRSIAQLLLSNDDRVCGNSAYILGSAVELEAGLKQFLTVFSTDRTSNTVDIIRVLCHLLKHSDSECVLNAAGTLGTICSSKEGRDLILNHACIAQMITNTSSLLSSSNPWIASNVALVLARITVEELGCQTILTHLKHREILNELMLALDISDPSRSTNAAFAIGRLIEKDEGKKILISVCGQYKILDSLLHMLEVNEEKGVNKNACYALSCLCTTHYGFQLCLQYLTVFHRILFSIESILSSNEHENVWFALMCLRTIAQYDGANDHLCYSKKLPEKLKQIRDKWITRKDVQDEAKLLWYMIHRNMKPNQPNIDECRNNSTDISWDLCIDNWDNNEFQYRIILDDIPIAVTNNTNYCLKNLKANTNYSVQIQYVTSHGDSILSDPTIFRTDEELPPPVNNLHIVRRSMTAARITWESPDLSECNSFKGYQVYLDNTEYECTTECGITISSLTASTTYQIDVCVISNKGKGPRATINLITASAGDSYPAPPTFSIIGRREIHIKWQPPEVLSGRFSRYELLCNKRCIYSGTDQEYHAAMLKPDTEYIMEVIVITNEGRFRSRPAKVRTLKDEFNNTHRHSLYETPSSNQNLSKLKRIETFDSVQLSGTNSITSKISSKSEQRLSKENNVSNRNVDMTTVHTLQLKPHNLSTARSLPGLAKGVQSRSIGTIKTRQVHRSQTNLLNSNQRQIQTRITASVIVPTLAIDPDPKITWATSVPHKVTQSTSFRLAVTSKPSSILNDTRKIDRCVSTSLPELSLDITRMKTFIPS